MRVSFIVDASLPRGARTRFRSTLQRLQAALKRTRPGPGSVGRMGGIGVLFTDDIGIRRHNARWRHQDRVTDVLSFEGDGKGYLGDLVISVERAGLQAAEAGHGLEDEIEILLLHGLLHLLGHDHEKDDGQMRRLEARLASRVLGCQALIERVSASGRLTRGAKRERGTGRA